MIARKCWNTPKLHPGRIRRGNINHKFSASLPSLRGRPWRENVILVAALSFILTGCLESPISTSAIEFVRARLVGAPEPSVTRKYIAKLPYATMMARIGDGPKALLILGKIENGDQHWISPSDRSVVVLRHGRIVKTVGLKHNLLATKRNKQDPVRDTLHRLRSPKSHIRYIDIEIGPHYGMPIHSVLDHPTNTITNILTIEFDTIMVRERNRAQTIRWEFENVFWVDVGDGFVWKSVQHIAPDMPALSYEILKPPS